MNQQERELVEDDECATCGHYVVSHPMLGPWKAGVTVDNPCECERFERTVTISPHDAETERKLYLFLKSEGYVL